MLGRHRPHLLAIIAALIVSSIGIPIAGRASPTAEGAPGSFNFELVGHDPLFGRGMNAAPALYNDVATGRTFVYVGNRTDGSQGHPHPGVLVVETTNPANPAVIGEIAPPDEGNVGETSRELRVWPEAKLLLVLNFTCSSQIHACDPVTELAVGTPPSINFYDLTDPANPTLVLTYETAADPHEIFLWVDPVHAGRALLYMSTPASSTSSPNLLVADISGVARQPREQPFELATFSANGDFTPEDRRADDVRLHSMGVSPDGKRTYLAYLGGGFLVLDSHPLTSSTATPPVALRLLTAVPDRPHWGNPGAHSAVEILGTRTVDGVERTYALTTDEVYGEALTPLQLGKGRHGCPWGWVRVLDVTDAAHPQVVGEYRAPQNDPAYCTTPDGLTPANTALTSYSSHNPTVLRDLAFVTWHSAGFYALDLADPSNPTAAGLFLPDPLPEVATEDPALSTGLSKVVMWSYPLLNRQGGQTYIYVVDIRNGLYILRYTGPRSSSVDDVSFLEGNSNLGDALALDGFVPPDPGEEPPPAITFGPTAASTMFFTSPSAVGEVDRASQFGDVGDGPTMGSLAPTGPTRVQETSRFGNPGLAANPLLAYFTYGDPVKVQGAPSVRLWVSAPGVPGVVTVPISVEVFVDGVPVLGSTSPTGSWVPISFPVDVGPDPTEVTLQLPSIDVTALSSLIVQIGVAAGTTDTQPKALAVLYGSPDHDSALTGPMAFPL